MKEVCKRSAMRGDGALRACLQADDTNKSCPHACTAGAASRASCHTHALRRRSPRLLEAQRQPGIHGVDGHHPQDAHHPQLQPGAVVVLQVHGNLRGRHAHSSGWQTASSRSSGSMKAASEPGTHLVNGGRHRQDDKNASDEPCCRGGSAGHKLASKMNVGRTGNPHERPQPPAAAARLGSARCRRRAGTPRSSMAAPTASQLLGGSTAARAGRRICFEAKPSLLSKRGVASPLRSALLTALNTRRSGTASPAITSGSGRPPQTRGCCVGLMRSVTS